MGSCIGAQPASSASSSSPTLSIENQKHGNRRKYSVYFPSEYAGKQKYAERECRNHGINFKDVQDIFNGKYKLPSETAVVDTGVETQVGQSNFPAGQQSNLPVGQTVLIDQQSTVAALQKTRSTFSTNTINVPGQHIVAALKRGDEDDQYTTNKDVFKSFDFNLPDERDSDFVS